MKELDLIQRRKHANRTLYAAACIAGVRLDFKAIHASSKARYGTGRYTIDGVDGVFAGADAVRGWFFERGIKIGVTQVYNATRDRQPVHGFTIRRAGTKRHHIGAVHEVRNDELHGPRPRVA